MAKKVNSMGSQSGTALVLALIMIIVITLLALASSYTSIFEIKLAGNKRGSTDAFYAADTGVNTITTNIANFNLNSYDGATNKYSPFSDLTNTTPNPTNAQVNITYVPTQSGPPPRGMGFSAVNLSYAYYQVQSAGKDQAGSGSTATIQEEVVRLLPVQ
jgi:Tfp pilus assembly protein PilX